jgi:hypothetical protein
MECVGRDHGIGKTVDTHQKRDEPWVSTFLFTDPDGLTYRLCTPGGSCVNNYSDSDFYFNFESDPSILLTSTGGIFANGQYIGYFYHLYDDPWYLNLKNGISNFMRYGSEEIQAKKQDDWYQRNYLGWAIGNAAQFIWPASASDASIAMVGGRIISKPVQKLLGGIEYLAGKTVREEILSRGGLDSTVNKVEHYADKTVRT